MFADALPTAHELAALTASTLDYKNMSATGARSHGWSRGCGGLAGWPGQETPWPGPYRAGCDTTCVPQRSSPAAASGARPRYLAPPEGRRNLQPVTLDTMFGTSRGRVTAAEGWPGKPRQVGPEGCARRPRSGGTLACCPEGGPG